MKHYVFLIRGPSGCSWGGGEKILLDYFTKVDYKFYKITCVTTKDIFSQRFRDKGVLAKVLEFPFDFEIGFRKRFISMLNFLKSLNPDSVVYVRGHLSHFQLPDYLAGYILTKGNIYSLEVAAAQAPSKKTRKMHFKIIPGVGLWWYKEMLLRVFPGWLCKKIVTISEEVRDRLIKWYYYPKKRVVTAYHGIDVKKFHPDIHIKQMMRKKFNISEKDIVIISTARFSKEKSLHRAINSFDTLSKEFKNCWLLLLGDGPLLNELQELTSRKLSKERIKFLGFQTEVSDFLKMGDIFVLPSDIEGLAIAMLEAMATGLISVVTKVPGPKEVLKNGINGFLTECNEEDLLKGLIEALSLTEKQKKEISYNAQEFVRENFEVEKRVKEALKILGLNNKE